uniref:Uncharacterized protein n=1 Tax=Vitis vinifera TaxID=29760 RepID=A5AXD7_VITVI|nr:hypothetical protein VITISV_039439 [Vitis vinifera]
MGQNFIIVRVEASLSSLASFYGHEWRSLFPQVKKEQDLQTQAGGVTRPSAPFAGMGKKVKNWEQLQYCTVLQSHMSSENGGPHDEELGADQHAPISETGSPSRDRWSYVFLILQACQILVSSVEESRRRSLALAGISAAPSNRVLISTSDTGNHGVILLHISTKRIQKKKKKKNTP